MTGDRILQTKLATAVTHVDLRLRNSSEYIVPSMLSNFRSLRHVSLHSSHGLVEASKWQPRLHTALVETLCVDCPRSDTLFLHPNVDLERDFGRGPSTWIDLGTMLPSLTRLEFADPNH